MAAKIRETMVAVVHLLLASSVAANVTEVSTLTAHTVDAVHPVDADQAAHTVHAAHVTHHLQVETVPPQNATPTTTAALTPATSSPLTPHPKLEAASVGDIVQQTKLGAEFLKTAVQLTKTLNDEDKRKMNNDAMMEATHDIVEYAKTLLDAMGHSAKTAPPPSSSTASPIFWTMRRSQSRPRPVCTVTSGYWARECECEFIPRETRPHRPRPDEGDDEDEDDDDGHHEKPATHPPPPRPHRPKPRPTRPARPVYPWHPYPRPGYFYPEHPRPDFEGPHGHYWSRPRPDREEEEEEGPSHHEQPDVEELADKVERLVARLSGLLASLSHTISSIHRRPGSNHGTLLADQREKLIRAPLTQVDKLRTIVRSQELAGKVKARGGPAMEHFLKQAVADVEAMVNYPDYLDSQLGKLGGKQPMVEQLQEIIDRLEPLSH